ncbi:ion transporter [Niastella populi]|uniref:Potassium channel protein n=1 Tax=Niastella populi TaxID=550983 RepID=A0A1V9F2B7_9BACT|nr:ion transporter [Niastella populi]OQP52499.1 potassium channel protein [Niastella populi]
MNHKLSGERKRLLTSFDRLLEGPMIFLGFVWLLLLIVELVWRLNRQLELLSLVIWIIFIFDFLVKFVLAPEKLRFLRANWLTAVSLIVPALRVFKVFRIFNMLRGLRGIRLLRLVSSLNRSMKSLASTMRRRGFFYVFLLTLVATFAGAAGMYAIERPNQGFENYGMALWWTAMRITTAGSDYWPQTAEGRSLAFLLAVFGYAVFGYVTATLATFFIGRDAEEKNAPVAGSKEIAALKREITDLKRLIMELRDGSKETRNKG